MRPRARGACGRRQQRAWGLPSASSPIQTMVSAATSRPSAGAWSERLAHRLGLLRREASPPARRATRRAGGLVDVRGPDVEVEAGVREQLAATGDCEARIMRILPMAGDRTRSPCRTSRFRVELPTTTMAETGAVVRALSGVLGCPFGTSSSSGNGNAVVRDGEDVGAGAARRDRSRCNHHVDGSLQGSSQPSGPRPPRPFRFLDGVSRRAGATDFRQIAQNGGQR